jgi:hypothetical protein
MRVAATAGMRLCTPRDVVTLVEPQATTLHPPSPFCQSRNNVQPTAPIQPWPGAAFYRCEKCDAEWGLLPPRTPERRREPRL